MAEVVVAVPHLHNASVLGNSGVVVAEPQPQEGGGAVAEVAVADNVVEHDVVALVVAVVVDSGTAVAAVGDEPQLAVADDVGVVVELPKKS